VGQWRPSSTWGTGEAQEEYERGTREVRELNERATRVHLASNTLAPGFHLACVTLGLGFHMPLHSVSPRHTLAAPRVPPPAPGRIRDKFMSGAASSLLGLQKLRRSRARGRPRPNVATFLNWHCGRRPWSKTRGFQARNSSGERRAVIPAQEVGTRPSRQETWTQEFWTVDG
jgi:hypothetical protein